MILSSTSFVYRSVAEESDYAMSDSAMFKAPMSAQRGRHSNHLSNVFSMDLDDPSTTNNSKTTLIFEFSFLSEFEFSVYMVCMMFRLPRSFFSLQCYHLLPYSNMCYIVTFTQALPSLVKMFVYIVILWIFSLLLTNVTSMGCFLQCDFLQLPISTRISSPAIQLTATTCSSPSCVR